MNIFDDVFGKIEERELSQVEKIQYTEDLLREVIRDLAFSRDELYIEALKNKTIFMVRAGETKLKKFKSDENMYISIPETIYEDIKDLDDFEQYHHILDTVLLTLGSEEYKEQNEDGDVIGEAELINKAVKKVEDYEGTLLDVAADIEYDDYGQPIKLKDDKSIFEPKKYAKKKADGSDEKDEDDEAAEEAKKSSESEEAETSGGTINVQQVNDDIEQEKKEQAEIQQRQYQAEYTSQSITDTDQKVLDKVKGSTFDYQNYREGSIINPKVKHELEKYVKDIEKELRGHYGKIKRLNPAKRISSKDICSDINDKIYIGKSFVDGKFIDQNIVVDCSGSMSGSPIEDAIKLCYVFNKLAQKDLLEGYIILTETKSNMAIKMPVHDSVIEKLGGTGGGEGLTKTLKKHKDKLRNKNVIVMTDGDLVEEPIPDKFWQEGRMNALGVYINKSVKHENLPGYDKNMKRWFQKTIIRNNFEDMVQKMLQIGLKASKK